MTEQDLIDLGFELNEAWDNCREERYYTLELSENEYYEICLISNYMSEDKIYVELFPYDDFKYNTPQEIKDVYKGITKKELICLEEN